MGCPVLIYLEVNLSQHSNTVLYFMHMQFYSTMYNAGIRKQE